MFVLHEHGARVYVNDADGVAAEIWEGKRSYINMYCKRERISEILVYCITEKQCCGYGSA